MARAGAYYFFLTFFIIYFGMHLYVYLRFQNFFQLAALPFFWAIVILAIAFPLTSIFERRWANKFTKVLYYMAAIWFGLLLFLVAILLLRDVLSIFVDIPLAYSGFLVLFIAIILSLYSMCNAHCLRIKKIKIKISKLSKPIRIVHLSDLHLGSIREKRFLARLVNKVNSLQPDFIVITGDIIDGTRKITPKVLSPLKNLHTAVYFCFGNHEFYYGEKEVMGLLSTTKIKVLRNQKTMQNGIQIVGIDHVEDLKDNPQLEKTRIDSKKPSILLIHAPIPARKIQKMGYDLQLSGHTHNGQLFPFNLLARFFYERVTGYHKYKNLHIYISPGTGTWGPPMRFGSKSEITVIELKS